MGERIKRFTILGGGSAGWLAASLLVTTLNRRTDQPETEIELIESPNIPIVGVGEATTLSTAITFAQMRIDEMDFLKHCDASLKCAVKFRNWDVNPDGSPSEYYHPFEAPQNIWGISPAYHWHRRARQGKDQPRFDHAMSRLPAVMDANRVPKRLEDNYFEGLGSYSFHLDATRLGDYLKEYCTSMGVTYVSADVVDVEKDERGFISALQLDPGDRHPVEFVIDCSGFRGLLIRQAMEEPFIPYTDHLLCDRALAVQIPHEEGAPLESFTTSTALGAGWAWNVPLYSRRGTGYVFSSAFRSDDEAIEEFRTHLGEAGKDAEPRVIPMSIGRVQRSWVKNCLAVGLSAGFIEPLESTSIHMIQVGIRRFLGNLPTRDCEPVLADRFNELMTEMYEDIRDFISIHYVASNKPGPFWEAARADSAIPDRVRDRLALWKHKLPDTLDVDLGNPLFGEWSYLYVLFGKHFFDDCDFPIDAAIADEDYEEFTEMLAKARNELMAGSMDHRDFLRRIHESNTEAWYRPDSAAI